MKGILQFRSRVRQTGKCKWFLSCFKAYGKWVLLAHLVGQNRRSGDGQTFGLHVNAAILGNQIRSHWKSVLFPDSVHTACHPVRVSFSRKAIPLISIGCCRHHKAHAKYRKLWQSLLAIVRNLYMHCAITGYRILHHHFCCWYRSRVPYTADRHLLCLHRSTKPVIVWRQKLLHRASIFFHGYFFRLPEQICSQPHSRAARKSAAPVIIRRRPPEGRGRGPVQPLFSTNT